MAVKQTLQIAKPTLIRTRANGIRNPRRIRSIPGGAGAIVSTPTDLVKFIETLFGGKLISQNSLEQMKTMRDNYGMAMFEMPFDEKKSYAHSGAIDSFSSMLAYFPEEKLAISIYLKWG